ncbi:hypothetical protein GW17_00049258 [Ensete ventricosum]|nr:hypothetical protein B296_00011292 [Ensete ventricosum]RWV88634.1 hypothetical protein GW17_00049258 [Ensete ventricosum]RZS03109.1 hypothetical protein BHM03_00033239 [Ensete ventricosum]
MELSAAAFRFHRCSAPHFALNRYVATANPASLRNPRVPPIAPSAVRLDRRDPLLLTGERSRLFSSWLRESKEPAFSAIKAIRGETEPAGSLSGKIAVTSTVTILLAVLNRVLYKLALVPMKEYPFFLAQVTTFG